MDPEKKIVLSNAVGKKERHKLKREQKYLKKY